MAKKDTTTTVAVSDKEPRKKTTNVKKVETGNIFADGILVSLRTRLWGATGKIEDDGYELTDETLDKKQVYASMQLLNDTTLIDAMRQVRGQAKRFIEYNSIYFPEKGFNFIPKGRIEPVDEHLTKLQEEYLSYGEDLVKKLKDLEADFAKAHPKSYDSSKYPSEKSLRRQIVFQYVFRIFTVPDKELGVISPAIYKKELEKVKADIEEMKVQTVRTVCKELMGRIDVLKEQCETGKVNQATMNSIYSFMERFDQVWSGFVNEKDVKQMMDDMKLYLEGTDADMLRYDSDFRSMVANKAAKIAQQLENKGYKRSIDI